MSDEKLNIADPFVHDLRMHPSDWDRAADGREKLRERRPEIIRAFDSAMAGFGRDRGLVADQLAYIAALALSAGEGLGLDVVLPRDAPDEPDDDAPTLRDEAAAVLAGMDKAAAEMVDQGVLQPWRERLRAAVERSDA